MKKQIALILCVVLLAAALTGCAGSDYKKAMSLFESGAYAQAAIKFTELGDYKNSREMVFVCKYEDAMARYNAGDYEASIAIFEKIQDYNDAANMIAKATEALMYQKYGDVFDLLTANVWYFNGGSNTRLNRISFTEEAATIAQMLFDGNGKHDTGANTYSYIVNDSSIVVSLDNGSKLEIAYAVSGGKLRLGTNEYFTPEEVDAGIQGYWTTRSSFMGMGSEKNIYFDKGSVKSEKASESLYGSNGEYFYYGPYFGSYTLNFGGLDTLMDHGNEWFFNIINGKPAVLNYDKVCSPSNGFPGPDGYSF